jgi:hypothetical protein
MKLPRRKFLHLAAGAAAFSSLARVASALDYPTRPVRIVRRSVDPGGEANRERNSYRLLAARLQSPLSRCSAGSN